MMSWRLTALLALSLAIGGACASSGEASSTGEDAGSGGDAGTGGATAGSGGTAGSGDGGGGVAGAGAGGAASGQGGALSGGQSQGGSGPAGSGGMPSLLVGGLRPTLLHLPKGYDPTKPAPLLVMLHGRSFTADLEEAYLGLTKQSDAQGFLYVHPSGTLDLQAQPFWNATDACCNFFGSTVDDEAYLLGLVDEIASKWSVDPKRVYLMGHSNGGFMAYRMACHHAERFAAIAVLAGEMYKDLTQCQPSAPVSVLHIQGTADTTIAYGGGSVTPGLPAFPSAETSVKDWVSLDGCSATGDTSAPNLDLEATLPGAETSVVRYQSNCQAGSGVEFWSIKNAVHVPTFGPAFAPAMTGWLLAHAKP
jgi:polyhydroxybutyrate depolymerase